jgi:peptide/nickel transport system substrate-binding protein
LLSQALRDFRFDPLRPTGLLSAFKLTRPGTRFSGRKPPRQNPKSGPPLKRLIPVCAAAVLFFCALPAFAAGKTEDRPLRYSLAGNPDTLDPQKTSGTLTFQVTTSISDTLVEPDEKGRIVPALAESWTLSGDGRLWTFRLRRGVSFHDASPLTSKDVKASFLRIKNPATASPKAIEFACVREIRTPDEFTVEFVLDEPASPLLASLASGWSAILPAPGQVDNAGNRGLQSGNS